MNWFKGKLNLSTLTDSEDEALVVLRDHGAKIILKKDFSENAENSIQTPADKSFEEEFEDFGTDKFKAPNKPMRVLEHATDSVSIRLLQ